MGLDEGAPVNARSRGGTTALMLAAMSNHKGLVALLLVLGADVQATTQGGRTALWIAGYCGHAEVARLLLAHAACPYVVAEQVPAFWFPVIREIFGGRHA